MRTNQGLIFQLPLAEINDRKVLDISCNQNDGAVPNGGVRAVGDPVFGSCLQFDGQQGFIELPAMKIDFQNGLTMAAWVYYEAFQSWSRILDLGNSEGQDNILWANERETGQLVLQLYPGRENIKASDALKLNTWLHLAATISPDGQGSLYVQGQAAAQGPLVLPSPINRQHNLLGKSNWPQDAYFKGKMAQVRFYNRYLTPDDIQQILLDDRSSHMAFQEKYPLDISLSDGSGGNRLPISRQPSTQNLQLHVTNTSAKTIQLEAPPAGVSAPDQDTYHLQLTFRPGSLDQATWRDITVAEPDWHLSKMTRDGKDVLALLGPASHTIPAGERLTLTLQGIGADPLGGQRNSRMEAAYQQITYAEAAGSLQGRQVNHLYITESTPGGSQPGPWQIGLIGSSAILNDGATANSLELQLTNISGEVLSFNQTGSPTPSQLKIFFDGQGEGEEKAWALATVGELRKITLAISDGWKPRQETQGPVPVWILTPTEPVTLAPGKSLNVTLANMVSSLPSGESRLYFESRHIPNHPDGAIAATVTKSPLLYQEDKVGIGTNDPETTLDVRGTVTTNGVLGFSNLNQDPNPDIGVYMSAPAAQSLGLFTDKKERVRIDQNGNVGIGTDAPQSTLHVSGGEGSASVIVEAEGEGNQPGLVLKKDGGAVQGKIGFFAGKNDLNMINTNSSGNLNLGTNDQVGLTINEYGQVGIGIEPGAQLDLQGNFRILNDIQGTMISMFRKAIDSDTNYLWEFSISREQNPGSLILSSSVKTAMSIDHFTGKVDFPNSLQLSSIPVRDSGGGYDLIYTEDHICREGSSQRYKKNIKAMKKDFHAILRLEPKTFQMKKGYGDPQAQCCGYLAEDLHEAGLQSLVVYDKDKKPDGIKYKKMVIYLNEVLKDHHQEIAEQDKLISQQQTKIKQQDQLLKTQQKQYSQQQRQLERQNQLLKTQQQHIKEQGQALGALQKQLARLEKKSG